MRNLGVSTIFSSEKKLNMMIKSTRENNWQKKRKFFERGIKFPMKIKSDQAAFSFLDLILLIQASFDRLIVNYCDKNLPDTPNIPLKYSIWTQIWVPS